MTRQFTAARARREAIPIIVDIVGPSGSGKTYSALEVAEGIQRVRKGRTALIDTEAGRAKHYAEQFDFDHVPFAPPHSSLDYLEAFKFCASYGATVIVVDSMSHEHEGEGGALEWHDAEKGGQESRNFGAWAKPKAARRRMINWMLQQSIDFVLCFRAKEKMKPQPGGAPKQLGWQPIGAEELIYESVLSCLLLPGSDGAPTWKPETVEERAIVKLPEQFRDLFSAKGQQLSADIGEQLALWAAGGAAKATPIAVLLAAVAACANRTDLEASDRNVKAAWDGLPVGARDALNKLRAETVERLKSESKRSKPDPRADEEAQILADERKAKAQ